MIFESIQLEKKDKWYNLAASCLVVHLKITLETKSLLTSDAGLIDCLTWKTKKKLLVTRLLNIDCGVVDVN